MSRPKLIVHDGIEVTEFQLACLRSAYTGPGHRRSTYAIASMFPGWKRKAGRAALVGHVGRAARRLQQLEFVRVLPPEDRWEHATVALRPQGEDWLQTYDSHIQ